MTRPESIELSILVEGLRFAVDHKLESMVERSMIHTGKLWT